jgi:iron complex outermembrane recepter protein
MTRSKNCVLLGGTALAMLTASAAHAQAPADAPVEALESTGEFDEIVVTARKVEEPIQTTPVTIAAFSGDDLDQLNINSATDLQYHTAGLQVGKTTSGPEQYTLRAQGTSFGQPSGVLQYFNMVPGNGGPIYDLESVQILKGPQGTLFGRTSTGGAVLFQPRRPGDEWDGYVEVEGGSRDKLRVEGAVNIPVAPGVLSLRLSGYHERQDGYVIAPNGVGYNNVDRNNFRIGALFTPTDWLENYTLVFYNRSGNITSGTLVGGDATSTGYNPGPTTLPFICGAFGGGAAGASGLTFDSTPGSTYQNFVAGCVAQRSAILAELRQGMTDAAAAFANGTLDIYRGGGTGLNINRQESWDLHNTTTIRIPDVGPISNISIKNIFATNLSSTFFTQDQDVDGSPLVYIDVNINSRFIPGTCSTSGPTIGQCTPGSAPSMELQSPNLLSNEVNVNFTVADRLDVLFGHFYQTSSLREAPQGASLALASFGQVYDALRNYSNAGEYTFVNDSTENGIFVQGILDMKGLIDGLRFTGGYRWNWNDNLRVAASTPTGTRRTTERSQEGYNYTLSADYQVTPNLFVYFVRSRSFKPGGTNPLSCLDAVPPCALTFGPESLRNTEVGFKWDWRAGDLRGRTNVALFSATNSDLQRRYGRSNGATATENAADARIRGIEWEQNLRYRNLEISGQVSYLDAKYTKWWAQSGSAFPCTDPINNANNDCADYTSSRFTGTPEWQAGATIRYTLPLDERVGQIVPSLTVAYQSSVNYADIPLEVAPLIGPAYTLFNARIEWNRIYGTSLNAAFYVRNLTGLGREAWLGANASGALGPVTVTFIEPRTFGAQLRYTF